ncbi:NUDIX hydrolase [Bifidobacterium sp. LC6]|uniref:NUDIX hydrolase n=1 Tax=Bifidobacterium colobi TaxID=2809026 RepID=A0ABS5UXM4_9BIFI|nr:NUDIX domain-containing protein [Bifidobacterium colobi]MBT1175520.1 NUDIX hydrolase [Bifidobacterium colobi]
MGFGNVSERRSAPPQVGVSVVILALGPAQSADQSARNLGQGNPVGNVSADDTASATGRPQLWLPLVKRVRQPFLGSWALPGGHLRSDRSLEQSAFEALESTTALHPRYLEQLYTFGDPDRSHGGLPMVSIVYWALVEQSEAAGFEDGDNVRWFPENGLPTLAFDHRTIIEYALERLRSKIEYSDVATRLLGPTFTLRQLHDVYEAIAGQTIDLANFRRKMLASGDLEDTGTKRREGRQRPAAVYRYAPKDSAVENASHHVGVTELFAARHDHKRIAESPTHHDAEHRDALSALIPSAHE